MFVASRLDSLLQDDLAELEARAAETAERPADGGSGAAEGAAPAEREAEAHGGEDSGEEDLEGAEGHGDGSDPFAGMTAMQRKMYELKQKLRQGQKANQHAVIAERKREKVRHDPIFRQ